MKQAIIYCRFSPRPNANECESNIQQANRCVSYCRRKGYGFPAPALLVLHSDAGISGKTLDRPGLTAAIEALQSGMVLVVDTRDRLARDMLVSLTIHQRVKEKGATVEIADGSPSRSTPEGNLMANVLDAFAQYDRERFACRTKAGLAKKKANGEWLGKPPIGWKLDKDTKQLVKDAGEQKVIEDILSMDEYGDISTEIAKYIDEMYYPCRGKPWSARTIRKIIAREKKNDKR